MFERLLGYLPFRYSWIWGSWRLFFKLRGHSTVVATSSASRMTSLSISVPPISNSGFPMPDSPVALPFDSSSLAILASDNVNGSCPTPLGLRF